MVSRCLLPYILHPTRVTDHSSTLIDNIFSNNFEYERVSGNIITQIADHFPQFTHLKKLMSVINEMFRILYRNVSSCVFQHVPFKQTTSRELRLKSKPWINPYIKK